MKIVILYNNESGSSTLETLLKTLGYDVYLANYTSINSANIAQIGSPFEIPLIIFIPGGYGYKLQGTLARDLCEAGYSVATTMTSNYPSVDDSLEVELGMVKPGYSSYMFTTSNNQYIRTIENDILIETDALVAEKVVQVKDTNNPWNNYIEKIYASDCYVPLAYCYGDYNKYCFGYIPKHTDTGKYFTNAPVFHLGWLFQPGLGYDTGKILTDVINYSIQSLVPPYKIQGYVGDSKNKPLSRTLRIYNQETGALQATFKSDDTGFYSYGLVRNNPIYIVCLPEDFSKNGMIHTNVIPFPVEENNTPDV